MAGRLDELPSNAVEIDSGTRDEIEKPGDFLARIVLGAMRAI